MQTSKEYWLKQLEEAEKKSELKSRQYEEEREKMNKLQKRIKRENITYSYIPKPSQSKLSIAPIFSETKQFELRSVEKTPLGTYLFMKYLNKNDSVNEKACLIYPDLDLVVDSIQLFYDIKNARKLLPKAVFDEGRWDGLKFNQPEIQEKYEKTKEIVEPSLYYYIKYLNLTPQGPQIKRDTIEYDENIMDLIYFVLRSQTFYIDKDKINFPYEQQLKKCLSDKNKRYIVFFLSLEFKKSSHANMIIIDKDKGTIERYEPQGENPGFYDPKKIDKYMKNQFPGYQYLSPDQFCKSGLQEIIEDSTFDVYQFGGFCKTWSFLYALFRIIMENDMELEKLNLNLHDLVLHFVKEFYEERMQKTIIPKDYNFVIEFLYEYIPEILSNGEQDIDNINENLGTKFVLNGKTIYSDR